MVLFDPLVLHDCSFFFQTSESCADTSWYHSTPDSFVRFDIAQFNFESSLILFDHE